LLLTACFYFLAPLVIGIRTAAILPVGAWYPESDPHDVQVVGNRAYHAAGAAGLLILDVTDPNKPAKLGVYHDGAGEALAVAVKGNFAFVAFGARELQVINITDRANPSRAGGFYATYHPSGAGSASDLVLSGKVIYLADGLSGLQLVDISNPSDPLGLSFYPAPGSADHLQLNNQIVTLQSSGGGGPTRRRVSY
jgi:hypothetical protein